VDSAERRWVSGRTGNRLRIGVQGEAGTNRKNRARNHDCQSSAQAFQLSARALPWHIVLLDYGDSALNSDRSDPLSTPSRLAVGSLPNE
jgi:hypothetical protein